MKTETGGFFSSWYHELEIINEKRRQYCKEVDNQVKRSRKLGIKVDIQAEVTQEYDTILDRNIYTVLVSQRLVLLRKAKSC